MTLMISRRGLAGGAVAAAALLRPGAARAQPA